MELDSLSQRKWRKGQAIGRKGKRTQEKGRGNGKDGPGIRAEAKIDEWLARKIKNRRRKGKIEEGINTKRYWNAQKKGEGKWREKIRVN